MKNDMKSSMKSGMVMEKGIVVSQRELAKDIYDLVLEAPEIVSAARPGQFVNVYLNDPSRLLPRPISIADAEAGKLRLIYRVTGKGTGTEWISGRVPGDVLELLGPLGNGYTELSFSCPVLLGGGIGIPPMLKLAKTIHKERGVRPHVILGYRDLAFMTEDFLPYADVTETSDTGETGIKGTVIDGLKSLEVRPDVLYSCGPKPMLAAVKSYAAELEIPAYLSLEERMACGIGACLGCVTETTGEDDHSHVKNARVCKDGPVFPAEKVTL